MLDRNIGFTDIYNAFHDPLNSDEWVRSLRIAHVEMDCEIARLYGLDSQMSYEFIDTKLGPRYLPVKTASDLILSTLYKLNSKLGFKIEKKMTLNLVLLPIHRLRREVRFWTPPKRLQARVDLLFPPDFP